MSSSVSDLSAEVTGVVEYLRTINERIAFERSESDENSGGIYYIHSAALVSGTQTCAWVWVPETSAACTIQCMRKPVILYSRVQYKKAFKMSL